VKHLAATAVILLGFASFGLAQEAPVAPAAPQLNLRMLAETLRAASTFHDLVKNLNVQKNLNPDGGSAAGTQASPNQAMARTAAMVGAGAGTGAAIGEWNGSQKSVAIGVIAGAAGGLILDQILRHKAAKAEAQTQAQADSGQPVPEIKGFKPRPAPPVR
jgi:hypothetical protein